LSFQASGTRAEGEHADLAHVRLQPFDEGAELGSRTGESSVQRGELRPQCCEVRFISLQETHQRPRAAE
jgi:hypothetical protein